MDIVAIVKADYPLIHDLAPRIREQDAKEVMASGGFTPLEALSVSLDYSDEDMCWVALINGSPEIAWGCSGCGDDTGVPWLLGSDAIYRIKERFLKESIKDIAIWHKRYRRLTNWVDVHNVPAIRWLSGLGFKPVEFRPLHGTGQQPFIRYESTRK